jgi:L-lactate dehydrogenase complex protein LldG
MSSRQQIINKIKEALTTSSEIFSSAIDTSAYIKTAIDSITPKNKSGLWRQFQKELEAISGEFYSVDKIEDAAKIILRFLDESRFERIGTSKEDICFHIAQSLRKNIPTLSIISPEKLSPDERKKEFAVTETAIVNPAFAVADIGSLVFLYDQTGTSYPHFLCDNIFALIDNDKIVATQFELFEKLDSDKSKNMVFVTGPSRTADIEKVLVLGAHGPRKLVVIKIEEWNTDNTDRTDLH